MEKHVIPYVPPSILRQYKRAPDSIFVNDDDPDLKPIEIKLPECPPLHLIDGYGLPANEQKFKRQELPKKLKRLQEVIHKTEKRQYTIDEIWEELKSNRQTYKEEIKFIEKQWYHRLHGYWFFNNGVPTYIDGWHWFYLSVWQIDIGYPSYRSRDRKFFLFARMCYEDKNSYGFCYPKHRREGATYKAECINYEMTSRTMKVDSGIQSLTDEHAEKVFQKHVVLPWKTLPFYFKPQYEGNTDPKSIMRFNPPAIRIGVKGSVAGSQKGLNSTIGFKNSGVKAYDTFKLLFYHQDEVGKSKDVDVSERWSVVKHCLAQGPKIHGLSIATSTVGDMEKEGGKNFEKLCKASNYHERSENNQTRSGLYTLFISAIDGLDDYIDEFGDSDRVGALKYIEETRKFLLTGGDIDAYSAFVRQFPIRYRECFRTAGKSSGFNLFKIQERLDFFRFGNNQKVRGDFEWTQKDKEVVFVEKPEGKFYLSKQLNEFESNLKYWDTTYGENGSWCPSNFKKYVAGGDPFKFKTTISNKKSNGGGAVFMKRDLSIDRDDKNVDSWKTHRFCCTYSNRPDDQDIYGEDMLMMCVYFGCYMFAEIDVPYLWDYFDRRGYAGFMLHRIDKKTQKFVVTPGITSNSAKQDIFSEFMTYIERHCHREVHDELLEEVKDIEGPEDMTHYDRFAAAGYGLLGALKSYTDYQQQDEEEITEVKFHRTYVYSQ